MEESKDLIIAYTAIATMTFSILYAGSYLSLGKLKGLSKEQREELGYESEDEENESISKEDAYMFPVYGSLALFSLYLLFKHFNKEYLNYLIAVYFSFAGVFSLTKILALTALKLYNYESPNYKICLFQGTKELKSIKFTNYHLASIPISLFLSLFYLYSKNWIVSNIFSSSFSLSAFQLVQLDEFKTGIILLGGLFLYDIFWVFGTEVMVSVAINFKGPIKLLFPKNLIYSILNNEEFKFTLLGLGDIVVPGIYVALCLRFDRYLALKEDPNNYKAISQGKYQKPYFTTCFISYVIGLVTTISAMHFFKTAQPALLYLSPACIISSVCTAIAKGQFKEFFNYRNESISKENIEKINNGKSKDDKNEILRKRK